MTNGSLPAYITKKTNVMRTVHINLNMHGMHRFMNYYSLYSYYF